jgi:hypothetical protein
MSPKEDQTQFYAKAKLTTMKKKNSCTFHLKPSTGVGQMPQLTKEKSQKTEKR